MITGIEAHMFILVCRLQIDKHEYHYQHNWDYYYENNLGSEICKLERKITATVKAYMNSLPVNKGG